MAWAFVYRGQASVEGESIAGKLVVLEEGNSGIVIEAAEASRILVGTAKKHGHRLVLGDYSVHTNRESLARGEARIREVRDELRRAGRL